MSALNASDSGRRERGIPRARALLLIAAVVAATLFGSARQALAEQPECGEVTIVWARGSGQPTVSGPDHDAFWEGLRFQSEIAYGLPEWLSIGAIYELGRDNDDFGISYSYPAYELTGDDVIAVLRQRGRPAWPAEFIRPGGYVDSVVEGMQELRSFLVLRATACPDEVFVLGGYSQGAHVVAKAFSGHTFETYPADVDVEIPKWVRDRVGFVALFGDPTLFLPKSSEHQTAQISTAPPSSRPSGDCAEGSVPYRRGNVSCEGHFGVLAFFERRNIYLPADMITGQYGSRETSRIGSWCDIQDPICNGFDPDPDHEISIFDVSGTHDNYADPEYLPAFGDRSWMEEAVVEAVGKTVRLWYTTW
ncbi:cutinase family protein [Candidatus Poriferisodalis sp.]|uniref:cutinase family protein n=1 Tax=Candidatus Poriferisodalis sp. TaxID=3101277 RepID=UPI003AF602A0